MVTVEDLCQQVKDRYLQAQKEVGKLYSTCVSIGTIREFSYQIDIARQNDLRDLDMLDFLSKLSDSTLRIVLGELYKDLGDFSLVASHGMQRRAIKTSKMIQKVELLI